MCLIEGSNVGLDNKKVVIRKSVHGFRLCNSCLLLVKLFYGVALMQNYLSKSLLDKAGSLGIDPFLQYFHE